MLDLISLQNQMPIEKTKKGSKMNKYKDNIEIKLYNTRFKINKQFNLLNFCLNKH